MLENPTILEHPTRRAPKFVRKALSPDDVRARADDYLYAIAYVIMQRQMRQRWGLSTA